jgi:PncC family amidohydrolase
MSSAVGLPPVEVELDRAQVGADRSKLTRLGRRDLAVRFGFGAAVSVAAGIAALVLGPRGGGVLLAFPAILPAALTLIEQREGTSQAVSDVRGAVIGAISLVLFAVTVVALAGRIPTALAILLAAAVWAVTAIALYFGCQVLARVLGEQQYLPDVAVVEAEPLVEALHRSGLTAAVAESQSGGVLAALIAAAPGGPSALRGGIVAASAEAKQRLLDVEAELLRREGDFSEAVAVAMAEGARRRLGSDVALAVAGPAGDGPEVGLTWVVVHGPEHTRVARIVGDRGPEANRGDAVRTALRLGAEVVEKPS